MKRQRSYGDGLDDDRRRSYDRGPPPPPRRPPRDYEGDRFDRRMGFGGGGGSSGGSYDNRYRDYPSPREYGGDRALHRSESFSGFRREFPKGFRSERDRPRRYDDGSSAWRRPGGGWRDLEGPGEHRTPTRPSGPLLPAPPRRSQSRSRSPIEQRRRSEVTRPEKSRKYSASINEMEEGEVPPDAEHKARSATVENWKQVEPSHSKEKGPKRGEVVKVEPGVSVDSAAQCKGVTGPSHSGNAGSEEGKGRDGLVAEAEKAIDKGRDKSPLKVEEEGEGRHELQSQNVSASDTSKFGLSTSPIQQEVLQEKMKPHEDATNFVNEIDQSVSPRTLKELVPADATHDTDEIEKSDSSSLRQGAIQEQVVVLHKTGRAADEVGKNTSSVTHQDVRQEELLGLNGEGFAVDEVGKGASTGTVEEALQEEVMQHDGTANAVDRVEISTSGMVLEAMQEKTPIPDESTNTVDTPEPLSYSGLMKEVMHDGTLTLDGTASTTAVANSSDATDNVTHEKAVALGGVTSAVDVAEERNVPTGISGEVVACQHQEALEDKGLENVTVIEEKMSEPLECVASQPAEEEPKMDHCEKRGAPVDTTSAEAPVVIHENVTKQFKLSDMEVKSESSNVFLQSTNEHAVGSREGSTDANMMTREPVAEDKGNGIAFDVLTKKDNVDLVETVGRYIDSMLKLRTEPTEASKSASTTSVKQEHESLNIGKLDLSLSLPDDDANLGVGPSETLRGIPCSIAEGIDGIPSSSRTAAWKQYTLEGLPVLEKGTFRPSTGSPSLHRETGEPEFHTDDNKPVVDELDSLVRLKQAEACMYQEHANDARRQADELRHIIMVKTARIEEDYTTRIAELNTNELQERRKQNIEELQLSESTHRQFFSMKNRMEASIRELLLKMEAVKQT